MTYKLPDGWKRINLKEVLEIQSGYPFKSKSFSDKGIPVIKIKNIIPPYIDLNDTDFVPKDILDVLDGEENYLTKYNDILISQTGSTVNQINSVVGKVGRVKYHSESLINQRVAKLSSNDIQVLNNDFLYHTVSTNDFKLNLAMRASGSANQANISATQIKETAINLPPLVEQNVIADTLSALDDKIELNNKINENLEKQAQAIFKHSFVDFEFPDKNGNPYKSSGGEMIDSELGMIPKGWEVKNLKDISTVQNGFAFKSKDYVPVGCPVIRTLNIDNNLVNNTQVEYLPEKFYKDDRYKNQRLEEFDTLLVMVGSTIGKTGMILDDNIPSLQNQNMWRFRPLNNNISPFYIHYQVHKINYEVSGWDSGSARSFYRKGIFQNAKLVLPKNNIMSAYNDISLNIFKIISINQQQNQKLSQLRDTLLPKLMSGEIRIPLD